MKAASMRMMAGFNFFSRRLELGQYGVSLFSAGLLAVLLVVIGVPVLMVVLMSLRTGFPGEGGPLTLENFIEVYADSGTYQVLVNTLLFALGSVAVALLFAVPLSWLLMRTDVPFKKTFYVLLTVGILIPVFLRTIARILLLSPRIGLLNRWLVEIFSLSGPPLSLYNIPGMAFIQGVSFVPGAFFMLSAAYRAMDPSLEEAAYTSGVSKFTTFLRINIPITLPAIAAVMVYLFMTGIAVFEVPAIIGLPARILVLSALIYTATSPPTGLPEYGIAGAYGAIMLVTGLALAYFYVRLVKEGKKYTVITGRGYRPREIALGRWKWPAMGFVLFYLSIEVFIPFVVLLWTSLVPYLQLPSTAALKTLTLENYLSISEYAGAAVHQHVHSDDRCTHDRHVFERAGFVGRGSNPGKLSRRVRHGGVLAARDPEHSAGRRFGLSRVGLPGLLSALRHHLHHHGGPCD